ncbi:MAG: methylated-DNA-protein-cysteine S-methyltransferase [Rhodobacteraceae bacterium]|uniref:methylated-DNA--[protein]-cysteine S-methyltransferase n=1 Tax=Cypionkella sp. TaxID=2811411 RepID=UPI00132407BA|nr:methylated-DNA--[protein]-cysteine S-methyltransferase [Cypionkella sp.]KAF0171913.1 MAG: methylated-DNA-protein-cysteine S-methyltransferase [Paracoccaceae bacterium]MDO8328346.1 methylated-DNA--[protein]-cysteine S-methyltransferase [Cypionkella sp.]
MNRASLITPLGPVTLTETAGMITALDWHASPGAGSPLLTEALRQLQAYFDRRLTRFDLPLDFGSGFQAQVRHAMTAIPYGETRRYGDLAREIGVPAQAIGQACGANPLPILIPCHRVLAANGLGGFSAKGGVESKVFLLKLEGAVSLLI